MKRALHGLILICWLAVTSTAYAQTPPVTLVGRAIMPAESYVDGPASGAAIASLKVVNGIRVPFASQPVGSVTSIRRGEYKGTWLLLSDKGFRSDVNSGDYLLRAYIVDVDWRRASTGSGVINMLDWITFSDPRKLIKTPIKNAATRARQLTGADFDPRAINRAADGTYWIGEANGPSLLHVSPDGVILQEPIGLPAGVLRSVGGLPDGKMLLIAERGASGNTLTLLPFNLASGKLTGQNFAYPFEAPTNNLSDLTLINDHQALVIEQDDLEGANAKFKRVYLIDFKALQNGVVTKTLLADLLTIADPANIATNAVFGSTAGSFGLKPFSFAFKDVSGVYPLDSTTLLVVNNNHFPFSASRNPNAADNTELIAIKLSNPLDVQLKDTQE